MIATIEHIGRESLSVTRSLGHTFSFADAIFKKIFDGTMRNSAMRMVFVNQIYFTAVQILPLFVTVSAIFGSLQIGIIFPVLKSVGFADYVGHVLMGFAVMEMAPLITVILVALRSGSAINTEIAVMKVNNELRTLEAFRIDVIDYIVLPRIVSGILSIIFLSAICSVVVLLSSFFYLKFVFSMTLDVYMNALVNAAGFSDILIFLLKCFTFGFFIMMIPILSGLSASHELTSIPVAVLHGMVRVINAIVIIEVVSLIIRFI